MPASPTQTATASSSSGTGRTSFAARGLSGASTNPARSAPASAATATSSSRVSPQTLTSGRRRSSRKRCGRVGRLHQGRADENRIGPGQLGCSALGARPDAALRDRDPVGGDPRDEGELRLAVDLERGEIAGVDTDHRSAHVHRPLELVGVVCLDERVEPEVAGDPHQRADRVVVEVSEQEQDCVGAGLLRGPEVLLGREEALREQGHAGARARRAEVVPGAAEALVDEDGDRGCAGRCVVVRDPGGVGVGADVAERGRAALDLGDRSEAGAGECVPKPHW